MAFQPRRRCSGKRSLYGLQQTLFDHTRFGDVPISLWVWEICRIDRHLRELSIVRRGYPTGLLTFAYVLSALIGSCCLRHLTDRWRAAGYLRHDVAEDQRLRAHEWSRLVAQFDFRPLMKDVIGQTQQWGHTTTCVSRGILILDDTPIENFGKKMEGAHDDYDHAERHHVWSYPLVTLIYQSKRVNCPVSFRIQTWRRRVRKPKIKHTKITLAREHCEDAARQELDVPAVIFHPAYRANKLLRHLDEIGYRWGIRLQSNWIVGMDGKRLSARQLARKWSCLRHDPVRAFSYISRQGHLKNSDLRVQAVAIRTPAVRYPVLLTSLMQLPWQEILVLFPRPFHVEVFRRNAKNYVALADFRYPALTRVNNFVALGCIRYVLLALMRIVFQELESLSWRHIDRSVLRLTQQLHVGTRGVGILRPPDEPLCRRLPIQYTLESRPLA